MSWSLCQAVWIHHQVWTVLRGKSHALPSPLIVVIVSRKHHAAASVGVLSSSEDLLRGSFFFFVDCIQDLYVLRCSPTFIFAQNGEIYSRHSHSHRTSRNLKMLCVFVQFLFFWVSNPSSYNHMARLFMSTLTPHCCFCWAGTKTLVGCCWFVSPLMSLV